MNTLAVVIVSVLEIGALAVIARLWLRPRRMSMAARIFWSILLLLPGFGLMMYGFIQNEPENHPDYIEEFGSADDPGGGDGGGH